MSAQEGIGLFKPAELIGLLGLLEQTDLFLGIRRKRDDKGSEREYVSSDTHFTGFTGMINVKVLPTLGSDSKSSRPPWFLTMMSRVMLMPSPVP